jgi:hypothetical protein
MSRKRILLSFLSFLVLVVGALGCTSGSPNNASGAAQPTPQATLDLPGAAGTPVIMKSITSNMYSFRDAYVTAETGFVGGTKTIPPVFPSGTKKLYLVVQYSGELPTTQKLTRKVNGRNGPVKFEFSSTSTSSTFDGKFVTFSMEPANGRFEDGPYQAIVELGRSEIAKLNWTVGPVQ